MIKKVMMIIVLGIVLLSLCGCTNELDDNLFDNTTTNHIDEAQVLLDKYTSSLQITNESIYSNNVNTFISNDESYIYNDIEEDEVLRHKLINYHLSNHKWFKNITGEVFLSTIDTLSDITLFISENCDQLIEGDTCKSADSMYSFVFQMEDNSIHLIYSRINESYGFTYDFYIYTVSSNMALELTSIRYDDGYHEEMDLNYYENDSIESRLLTTSKQYPAGVTSESLYDYETGNHYFVKNIDNSKHIQYFDGESNALYYLIEQNQIPYYFRYEEYNYDKLIVSYSEDVYKVNLMEFPGWDRLIKLSDNGLYEKDTYLVYDGYQQLNDLIATFESEKGEYVLGIIETEQQFSDDVLSLSKYGFESEYNQDYFNQKEEYMNNKYISIINLFVD